MKVTLPRATLRATARIVFGSHAAGALLGASAWPLGLMGCGGQALVDEPSESNRRASGGASSAGGASTVNGSTGGWSSHAASGGRADGEGGGFGTRGGAAMSGGEASGGSLSVSGGAAMSGGEASGGGLDTRGAGAGGADAAAGGESIGSSGSPAVTGGRAGGTGGDSGIGGGATAGGGATNTEGGTGTGPTDTGDACVGPVTPTLPPTLPGPSDAEYACCLAKVSTATNDWSSEEGKALAQTEPVANCCRALIAAVDIDGSRYRQVNPVRAACCTSNAVQGSELFLHRLCTPWGPPMPPALDWQAS